MKVGIEAQRIFRTFKHGMDVVVLELIKQIQLLDQENEYIVFVKDGPDKSCLQESSNVKVEVLSGFSYPDWEQISLPRAVKKYGLDLLHLTSNTAPLNVSVPTIITLHDIIYLEKLSLGGTAYQNFGNLYRRWNVPQVVKKASKIITVSDFEKGHILKRLPRLADKLEVVHNGLSPMFRSFEESDPEIDFVRKQFHLPEDYVFFLGNMAPKKNMKGVLKAYGSYVTKAKQVLPLVMAETSEGELHGLLGELDLVYLKEHIQLTGYISQQYLPAIYAASKLFLYPSLRESFGMPLVEAMACGTAVITSNTSSMPEIAGGAACLIDPLRTEDIAEAMLRILAKETERQSLISKGFENAQRFSWQRHAERVLSFYSEVLNHQFNPSAKSYQKS